MTSKSYRYPGSFAKGPRGSSRRTERRERIAAKHAGLIG